MTLSRWLAAVLLLSTLASAQDDDPHGERAHRELFAEDAFPSAMDCAACHPRQYREWSVSPHAYAKLSPIYNAFQRTMTEVTGGTIGDFCVRCHTQVGMWLDEDPREVFEKHSAVAREGVTCVVCHRVGQPQGKVTGRLLLEPGDIFTPVHGPHSGDELSRVLSSPDEFKRIVTEAGKPGRRVHAEAVEMAQMQRADFCGRCHDVRAADGMRVEDAFSEYKQTPAAHRGDHCQECHMGPDPGIPSHYEDAPAAVVGGKPTRPTKRTNHMFVGPDDSIVHPGVFPHSPDAQELASIAEWLEFNVDAGWGQDDFEDLELPDEDFPERWSTPDDRYDARDVIDEQLELLAEAHERATKLLRVGYRLGEVRSEPSDDGLAFAVDVFNGTDGHSVPTGLIAERMVFVQAEVFDAHGEVVFRSGDLDPNGDVRDGHSSYVAAGELALDEQLFSLRSPFLVRGVHGSERDMILPANLSVEPLAFVRPSTTPALLMGGVPGVRLHKRNIEVGGFRTASYRVPTSDLSGAGPYTARVQLVVGMHPPHLIREIGGVGFEFGMSTRDVAEKVLERYRVLWTREVELDAGQ